MKNYVKQHDDAKQVSMTGARALILLLALMEGEKTFEEIRDLFIESGFSEKQYSIDTVRIDINTLKQIGCKITKATKRNNHKYRLISQPMVLSLNEENVSVLKSLYKKALSNMVPEKIVAYHKLFTKLADMVEDEEIKVRLYNISILKSYDIELLEELVLDAKKNNKIKILYHPAGTTEYEYDITLEKISVRNGKLYIYCYNHTMRQRMFLKFERIKAILCKMFDKGSPIGLDTCVKFKLKNHRDYIFEDIETIIEEHEDYAIVEGRYFNEFIAIQRILSFGADCTVLEPSEIKKAVIQKLKEMRSIYE